MKRNSVFLLAVLAIAGCSTGRSADEPKALTYPKGPWQHLNPARALAGPGPNDLVRPQPGSSAALGMALSDRRPQ